MLREGEVEGGIAPAYLICDTGEGGSELRRRELLKMDGNNTPCALNHELNEEGAGSESAPA